MSEKPQITDDTPLPLKLAAELAFAGGGMTASGLRKEAGNGRLVIERIAGKEFTTLGAIKEMRKLCVLNASAPRDLGKSIEHPPQTADHTAAALTKLRMRLYYREEDGKLKDLAMAKRERDALEACSRGKGAFIDVDRFWRRTIRWLEVRGFIEVRLDRDPLSARITPAGEAKWRRISEQSG
jgi:hypothetical protein